MTSPIYSKPSNLPDRYFCLFCHNVCSVLPHYNFFCFQKCKVEFQIVDHQLVSLTYRLEDPVYSHLIMQLGTQFTTVYGRPDIRFSIPEIWPQTKPKDAINLAKRLHKLLAFS